MADVKINVKVVSGAAEKAVSNLGRSTAKTEKQFKSLNVSIKNTTSAFKVFAGNIAANAVSNITNAFAGFVSQGIQTTKNLETITTQFEVLTGSVAEANKVTQDLVKFAEATPFRFEGIAKAAQRLLSFGFSTEEVNDRLKDLGDVSAASGADLAELSLIFGQVRAAGKLTGERLLQFQERAIPIGPALAKSLGVAESEIKKLVSEGKVDFAEFEKAFTSLNDTGEFAFGGLEKRSRTLDGRLSTLSESIELFAASFVQKALPAFKAIVLTTTQVIESISKLGAGFEGLSDGGSIFISIASALVQAGTIIINTFQGIRFAVNIVSAGFTAILTTAVLAAEGLVKFASVATSALGLEFPGLSDAAIALEELRVAGQKTADSLLDDAEAIAVGITTTSNAAEQITNDLKANFAAEQAASKAAADATIADKQRVVEAEKAKTEALTQEQIKQLESKNMAAAAQREADAALFLADEEAKAAQDGIITEREALQLQILADQRATANEKKKIEEEAAFGQTAKLETLKTKTAADQSKRRTAIILKEAQLERAENRRKLQETGNLFGALAGLASTGGAKLFKITQGFQLAQATVAGISAIQQAASALPYPANIPGIVIETVRAATSLIKIKQASPGFQQGGIVPGNSFSGDNVQARVNSGEMILNRQQQAQLFEQANGGGSGGRVIQNNLTVELDGEVIARSVSRSVADGLELGEVV